MSEGQPRAGRRHELVCRVIAALATLWFLGVAGWELAGPFAAGHYAAGPSFAVAAENSLRFHEPGPVPTQHLLRAPQASEIYCHHPWGFYWLMTLFIAVLGHHDWVVRLPALLFSGLTVPLLYGVARSLWGPASGAVAALAFVTLPIALAFCNLSNLEVPAIFGMLWIAWASLRFLDEPRPRRLGLALAAIGFACAIDWPALPFTLLWLGVLALGAAFPRQLRVRERAPLWRLSLFGLLVAGLVVGLQLAWFARLGQLGELLRAAEVRSAGSELPLGAVLAARRYWLELSFTWLGLGLGTLLALLLVLRVVLLRRLREACVLALLGAALFHYLVFKNGADVHVFWAHYFAPYYALALGALPPTLLPLLAALGRRLRLGRLAEPEAWGARALVLLLGLTPSLAMARDGVVALVYARRTGGRFDQGGALIHADRDKQAFIRWLAPQIPKGSGAVLDLSIKPSLWMSWSLGHPLVIGGRPLGAGGEARRFFLLDARFLPGSELRRLAQSFRVLAAGPFWAVDSAVAHGALEGSELVGRAPSALERYFVSGVHDSFSVEPSALATWELRDHFAASNRAPPAAAAAAPAASEADSVERLRLLHNAAIAAIDEPRAHALRQALTARLARGAATDYADGTRLLGVARERAWFRLLFEAPGPAPGEQQFRVFSRVVRKLPWSLVPADRQAREVGLQSPIPRTLWKQRYIYCLSFELLERPGGEVLHGAFTGVAPPDALGRSEPVLLGGTD